MKIRRTLGVCVAVAVSFAFGGALTGAASTEALTGAEQSTVEPTAANPVCWTEVETRRSACAPSSELLAQAAFDKYGITFANSGEPTALTSASQVVAASAAARADASLAPLATWIYGTVYTDRNGAGYSWTTSTQTANPCAQGVSPVDGYESFFSVRS